jgi:hypothetical protein
MIQYRRSITMTIFAPACIARAIMIARSHAFVVSRTIGVIIHSNLRAESWSQANVGVRQCQY